MNASLLHYYSLTSVSFVDYFNSKNHTHWRDQLPSGLTQEFSPLKFPPAPTQQLPSM